MKSNEDQNGHLVPNLEFEETNDAVAISVKSKEFIANSMPQSGQGRDTSNSTKKSDLMNQAEINVVDEQVGEERETNQDGKEEESFERVGLSENEAPDPYLIFVFFLHGQNFWRIKFTPKNANFSR